MTDSLLLPLSDYHNYLQIPVDDTSFDTQLTEIALASQGVISWLTGRTLGRQKFTELHDGGDMTIRAYHVPIVSVQSVSENTGSISWELDYQSQAGAVQVDALGGQSTYGSNVEANASPYGYSLDDPAYGLISARGSLFSPRRFAAGFRNIEIVLTAGYTATTLPPVLALALRELVQHIFSNSQLRSVVSNAGFTNYDAAAGSTWSRDFTAGQPLAYAIPNRVLELIGGYRRDPVFA